MKRQSKKPAFTSPPFPTVFQHMVWDIVERIPRGNVTTYGRIAAMIPRPRGVRAVYFHAAKARWVGSAMAACPGTLPWHRVVNSQGKISVRSGNDHHWKQRKLLEAEGVRFNEKGRTDLGVYLWDGK